MLPEFGDAHTIVLSDVGHSYEYVLDFVLRVAQIQPDHVPYFLINSPPQVIARLRGDLTVLNRFDLIEKIHGVDSQEETEMPGEFDSYYYEWHQDYFKPQFDRTSGQPVARLTPHYPSDSTLPEELTKALKQVKISVIKPDDSITAHNGLSGGNIDMLPGGVCVVGDSDIPDADWESDARAVCGPDARLVKAHVNWTRSSHIDEILKVVPNFNVAGCGYSVLVPSPRVALRLLENNINEKSFSSPLPLPPNFSYHLSRVSGLSILCTIDQYKIDEERLIEPHEEPGAHLPNARELDYPSPDGGLAYADEFPEACSHLTNKRLLHAYNRSTEMKLYTRYAQAALDELGHQIVNELKMANPSCKIDLLEIPGLFIGKLIVDHKTETMSLAPGFEFSGYSVFPNPTNSILLRQTLMMSVPYNPAFERYLKEQLNKRGIKIEWFDTLLSHEALGNLHCTTQVLRSCLPMRPQKERM